VCPDRLKWYVEAELTNGRWVRRAAGVPRPQRSAGPAQGTHCCWVARLDPAAARAAPPIAPAAARVAPRRRHRRAARARAARASATRPPRARLRIRSHAPRAPLPQAMAAVAGILFTSAIGAVPWYEAGAAEYGIPPLALLAIMAPVMGFLETKRLEGWLATGQSGLVNTFPFDPLGQGKSADMKVKEVKNARVAMVAFVGFATQALVTRQSPLDNLQAHLADPFHNNIIGSIAALPQTLGH
jgi:hypothetical protein